MNWSGIRQLACCTLLTAIAACDTGVTNGAVEGPSGSGGADPDAPGMGVGDPGTADCTVKSVGQAPLRFFTSKQYANAIHDLFPPLALDTEALADQLPQDISAFGFETNAGASLDDTRLSQMLTLAESVSQQVATRFAELMPCALDRDCAEQFINTYGERAFRRDLNAEERTELLGLWDRATDDTQRIRAITEALLVSPDMLYQIEVGENAEGKVRLTGPELATKLSLLLWDTIPDAALLAAAKSGALHDETTYLAEFERLFAGERAQKTLANFHLEWLDIKAANAAKDPTLFPDFTDAVYGDAIAETEQFVTHVLTEGGNFQDLLLSTKAFVTPKLANLYGVSSPGAGFQEVTLNGEERAGILTRVGFLASTSGEQRTSVTLRGVALRAKLLCQEIPEPPANVQDSFPQLPNDPSLTAAELIELHQAEPSCAGCHAFIDPVGLLFENYDAVGKYRDKYLAGQSVVTQAEVVPLVKDGTDVAGSFEDALALSAALAKNDGARICYADSVFRYALLREVRAADECAFDRLVADFYRGDLSLKSLFKSLVLSPSFRLRSSN